MMWTFRSLDERSDIRDGVRVAPDVAALIRATALRFARNDVTPAEYDFAFSRRIASEACWINVPPITEAKEPFSGKSTK